MKSNRLDSIKSSSWLVLSPFLLLYLTICVVFSPDGLVGDEGRYINMANNLLEGFYSPAAPGINLWNGPGYPLFLSSLLSFNMPILVLRAINGVLLYLSLIIVFKTLHIYLKRKRALLFTIFLGLYFPVYEVLPLACSEIMAWFLISLVSYLFIKNIRRKTISFKYIILSALSVAYLALTKVIFGYVVVCMLAVSVFLFLFPALRIAAGRSAVIWGLSLLFCFPYLIYTYQLTNKVFYWSNAGGMSLYTMSTPYQNEYGDWTNSRTMIKNPNHSDFIKKISSLKPLERDDAFKEKALENIKNHPGKYILNMAANFGRMLFSYPFSYSDQSIKTYFVILPNMFVAVFIFLSAVLAILYYRYIPKELIFLLLFLLTYFFGSSMLSAFRRMFYVTMPVWALFISYMLTHFVSIKRQPVDALTGSEIT